MDLRPLLPEQVDPVFHVFLAFSHDRDTGPAGAVGEEVEGHPKASTATAIQAE